MKSTEGDLTEKEMKISSPKILVFCLFLPLLLQSCGKGILYSDEVRMKDEQWSMYDPAKYACTVDDTISPYNLTLSIRTSSDYPYRNIYMFIITSFPSGASVTDTIQGILSNEKGEWLGKGAGDIRELTIPYKANVFFPEKGEYHFTVIHGMRDTVLNGVYDLGIKIALRTK